MAQLYLPHSVSYILSWVSRRFKNSFFLGTIIGKTYCVGFRYIYAPLYFLEVYVCKNREAEYDSKNSMSTCLRINNSSVTVLMLHEDAPGEVYFMTRVKNRAHAMQGNMMVPQVNRSPERNHRGHRLIFVPKSTSKLTT